MKKYAKFAWVGNRISDEDMAELYRRKTLTKKPITVMVAEAVRRYCEEVEYEQTQKSEAEQPRIFGA